jgi:hypothetical protein
MLLYPFSPPSVPSLNSTMSTPPLPVAEPLPHLAVFQPAAIFPLHGELNPRAPFSSAGWSLTSSCRTSSPSSPSTGPRRRLGTSMSHHLSFPSSSTWCSGEHPPPPSCQAFCRCPHGACTAFPGTPCPSVSPGQARRRSPCPALLLWAEWPTRYCTVNFPFFHSPL